MDSNLVTTDSIISWITEQVEKKNPIDPHVWMDASLKLNVLLQEEQEKLFQLEQMVSLQKRKLIEEGKNVSYAKAMIEATDEYRHMRTQKAKVERVVEFIRLSKVHSRIASDLMRNSL